jgi:hypothetical protein
MVWINGESKPQSVASGETILLDSMEVLKQFVHGKAEVFAVHESAQQSETAIK